MKICASNIRLRSTLTVLLVLAATPSTAHHNWQALYDVNSDIEFEGEIQSVKWRNPHVRVSFVVGKGTPDEKIYTTESNSVASLTRMNVTEDLLAVGTKVRVAGYRSRSGGSDIFMNHLLLPHNREIIFQRTAEPRWPDAGRIGLLLGHMTARMSAAKANVLRIPRADIEMRGPH